MDIWQEIRNDQESGAKRLVSEYGDRLFAVVIGMFVLGKFMDKGNTEEPSAKKD